METLRLAEVSCKGLRQMRCQEILQRFPEETKAALYPSFLLACADGSITPAQFDTLLQQDYHFMVRFEELTELILANAPREHADVLASGVKEHIEELRWDEDMARKRGLSVDVPITATCAAYIGLMSTFDRAKYVVQAAVMWAIEYVFNQAWQLAGPLPEPYGEFAERWGSREFGEFVEALQRQADEVLQDATEEDQEAASDAVVNIFKMEARFWKMAYESK